MRPGRRARSPGARVIAARALVALVLLAAVAPGLSGCTSSPQAALVASATSGQAPLTVTFTNNSRNADRFEWDFGDGQVAVRATKDPVAHEYTKAGTHTVTLKATKARSTQETSTASLTITIEPQALNRVELNTRGAAVAVRGEYTFAARALDRFNNPLAGVEFAFSSQGQAGDMGSNGRFIAGTVAGTYQNEIAVEATHNGITKRATGDVSVEPGALGSILIDPTEVEVGPGQTYNFAATAVDIYGNRIPNVSLLWDAAKELGTITRTGELFTEASDGAFRQGVRVTAVMGDIARTALATVTVNPGISTKGQLDFVAAAFTRPLPDVSFFINPPVSTFQDLRVQTAALMVAKPSEYFEASTHLRVTGPPKPLQAGVQQLDYLWNERQTSAFAYYRPGPRPTTCATLIIPGSGTNLAAEIVGGYGYHGDIAARVQQVCDVLVLIMPADGARAIHNGQKALSWDYVYVPLLNSGFSYSATYLVEALAWATYLNERYLVFGVAGLSQGGEAALLTSLQASPDFAVISAGFSLRTRQLPGQGVNQIILPGYHGTLTVEALRSAIASNNVRYLFTYGKRDGVYYAYDAETLESCEFLWGEAPRERVACVGFDGGHEFPGEVVVGFLRQVIAQR